MATETGRFGTRRQQVLLGALATLLVIVLVYSLGGSGSGSPAGGGAATSNRQARGRQPATRQSAEQQLDVRIDALNASHEGPRAIERNPFRFEARRRVEEPEGEGSPAARRPAPPQPQPEPVPSGPPPPPPIPLKFIGIIESPTAGRVAALSDGNRVFQGRAGDIIEGRYRIVRIGAESIVMEYADGSGTQQTIRLSGQ